MTVVVGVADCKVTSDPSAVLVTYALGSCIAISVYDQVAHVGGLLHFMLPEASLDPAQAARNPYMYADSGIPLLFREAYRQGAEKRRLQVCMAGGANIMDDQGVFNIGQRNCVAARRIFWKAGILVQGEDTGGKTARTMRLELSSGRRSLRFSNGSAEKEL